MNNQFEQQFAKLAENHITGRLPELNPYYQGFRMIDKSDDGSRAVGIAGYRVGKTIAFVPVVFYEGDLLGSDILIFKDIELFAPAIPKWIDAVKSQTFDASDIGKAVKRSSARTSAAPGDIMLENHLILASKTAEDNFWLTKEALVNMLSSDAKQYAKDGTSPFCLEHFLAKLPQKVAFPFYESFRNDADFANATLRFYHYDNLKDVAEAIQKSAEAESSVTDAFAPQSVNKVTVIDNMAHPDAIALDAQAKKNLASNGVYVKDNRETTSKLFDSRIRIPANLVNPSSTGVYMVLKGNGDFETMLVLRDTQDALGLCCNSGSSGENHMYSKRQGIMQRDGRPSSGQDLFIAGAVSTPVRVLTLDGRDDIATEHTKVFTRAMSADEIEKLRTTAIGEEFNKPKLAGLFADKGVDCVYVLDTKGNVAKLYRYSTVDVTSEKKPLTHEDGVLYIPSDARIIVRRRKGDKALASDNYEPQRLKLGSYEDSVRHLKDRLDVHDIKIGKENGLYRIESEKGIFPQLNKKEAAEHLAIREGISGAQTIELLKAAERKMTVAGLIKYAAPYSYDLPPNDGIEDMRTSVNVGTQVPIRTVGRMDAMSIPEAVTDQAVKASDNNNKDMFDIKVIEGIIRATDIADLRKQELSDILKGMNSLGRLLLTQYWRRDLYEERYGDDVDQLIDKTKQAFQSAGDVALYLKEKMSLNADSSEHQLDTLSRNLGGVEQE